MRRSEVGGSRVHSRGGLGAVFEHGSKTGTYIDGPHMAVISGIAGAGPIPCRSCWWLMAGVRGWGELFAGVWCSGFGVARLGRGWAATVVVEPFACLLGVLTVSGPVQLRVCRGVMVGVLRRVGCVLVAVGVLLPTAAVGAGAEPAPVGTSGGVEAVDVSVGGGMAVGGFGDVDSGSVHAGAIERLAGEGVFEGTECEGGGFCPGEPLARWVMAVWLVRILDGVNPEGGTSRFSDVEVGVWWEPYVERLAELGVTAGCATAPERYCPDRSVTRAQMATFFGRAYSLAEAGPGGFVDTAGNTHEKSIDSLFAAGVTAGCRTGPLRYCPQKSVTRAQMATFLLRASTGAVVAAPSPVERVVVVEEVVGQAGGVVEAEGVTVTVPAGAVSEAVVVAVREPLGRFGTEVGGPVVELDHQRPLVDPVMVSWDVSHLSTDQQDLLLVVTWDDDQAGWVTTDDDYTVGDGRLVARIGQWSNRSWLTPNLDAAAGASQTIQELFGRRVDAPKCAPGPLPFWVSDTTEPDEGSTSAAIRLCYEHGGGETLTMRMANNRALSQYVYTDRAGGWGEYWLGPPEVSLVWYAQLAAHKVLSNGEDRVLIPPLREVRADFLPSSVPGNHSTVFTTGHDLGTFLADALFFGLSKVQVPNMAGSVTSKVQLFLEVLFECGIHQAGSASISDSANSRLRAAVGALVSCSQEILDPKSRIGGVLRDRLTKKYGPTKGLSEMRRSFPRITNGLLAFWEGTGYVGDQILQAEVGDLHWVVVETIVEGPGPGVEPYSVVSAGATHTCAIAPDQTIACWGAENEQFDYGQTNPPQGTFTAVASGEFHSCGVRTNGAIACWGANNTRQSNPPITRTFKGVTAGANHTCGIHTNGTVDCWGSNASGQTDTPEGEFLALAAGGNHTCGTRIGGVVECWGDTWSPEQKPGSIWTFKSLTAGTDYTCGVAPGGPVECWGFSDQAEPPQAETVTALSTSGTSRTGNVSTCGLRTNGSVKCWGGITGELDGPYTAITVGDDHICAQRPDGTIHCDGDNSFGQLNIPDTLTQPEVDEPTTIDGGGTTISVGGGHSCGIRTDATAVCWGLNDEGQADAPSGTFTAISAGGASSCGIRSDGTAACWGDNFWGQADAPSGTFTAISAGGDFSCGIQSDGTVVCWGYNGSGRADAPSGTFTAISAGGDFSCGIRSDGAVVCWGWNFHGQVDAPSGTFTAISAGSVHSCGVRSDGTAVCWGENNWGQVDAPSGTFTAISAGGASSCGIRSDGAVVCWGWNFHGQVDAPSGTFTAISAGGHSCGVRSDGRAVCWGYNRWGQVDAPSGTFAQP